MFSRFQWNFFSSNSSFLKGNFLWFKKKLLKSLFFHSFSHFLSSPRREREIIKKEKEFKFSAKKKRIPWNRKKPFFFRFAIFKFFAIFRFFFNHEKKILSCKKKRKRFFLFSLKKEKRKILRLDHVTSKRKIVHRL